MLQTESSRRLMRSPIAAAFSPAEPWHFGNLSSLEPNARWRVRILIVEDDPKVARTLVSGLEADHFAVDLVANGDEAVQLVVEIDYDAVILDWTLPGVNGLAVLQRLRKSGSRARVLFLSAHQEVADRVAALRSGADDFLTKPFSFEELRARLYTLLRRPQENMDKLVVDDLELDRTRRTVTRAGKPITLTQREYGVLEYLMRNAGRTVTRSMIVEHVWNLGFKGLTNIVEVYINYLRIKIDQPFGRPLIHTERGVGYKLCPPEREERPALAVDNTRRML
jgi:DNA-binding response OmpR family regulator